jgi:hypothetical protein
MNVLSAVCTYLESGVRLPSLIESLPTTPPAFGLYYSFCASYDDFSGVRRAGRSITYFAFCIAQFHYIQLHFSSPDHYIQLVSERVEHPTLERPRRIEPEQGMGSLSCTARYLLHFFSRVLAAKNAGKSWKDVLQTFRTNNPTA